MSVARRHILPFFIPHLGCPNQCIFCDQRRISGQKAQVLPQDLAGVLAGLPGDVQPELAFYGGSFTAIAADLQVAFLQVARQALDAGKICGIRVSTRPDAIDDDVMQRLAYFGVGAVELGVQSMTDDVLARARRGHAAADAINAVRQLKAAGFVCGVQLMPGLPGETPDSCLAGAARILAEGPDMLRIYPTVVVAGTDLADEFLAGRYQPLALDEAVDISLKIKLLAENLGVSVIRTGLQPTEELTGEVLAGPYHPAFGFLVQAACWRQKLLWALADMPEACECFVNKRDIAAVVGYKRGNMVHYPAGFKVRGRELAPGAVMLRNKAGQELVVGDAEFMQSFVVAFWPGDVLQYKLQYNML